jgi:division protein CdvB (Snf7/Vps24/ESCRT-III family)
VRCKTFAALQVKSSEGHTLSKYSQIHQKSYFQSLVFYFSENVVNDNEKVDPHLEKIIQQYACDLSEIINFVHVMVESALH